MNKRPGLVSALLALLAMPALLAAQEGAAKHSRYILKDLGTFGGPNNGVSFASVIVNPDGAAVGEADTSIFDPDCGCYVFHAFKWRNGVLTDLGTLPGGANSAADAINAAGIVAGASQNGLIDPVFGPEFAATMWKKNGQIVDLGTLGGLFSLATAINNRNDVAGGAENTIPDPDNLGGALTGFPSPTQWHAALWENGTIRDLGTLGDGPDSFADLVNEHRQVIGTSYTNSIPNPTTGMPTVDPFFWERGHMVDIGTLGGTYGTPLGLNNRGQVAGTSNLEGDQTFHPFLWESGSLTDLGTLGGSSGVATWIDDSGEIVGGTLTTNDETGRAFRWKNGHMTNLGSLNGDPCSQAWSSNSRGQIVGNSISDCAENSRAFMWEKGGPMVDLNDLIPPNSGLLLREGVFIGEGGEIAVNAVLANGDEHVCLLIPREREGDDTAEGADAPSQDDVAVVQSSANATHTRLTPERLAAFRASFANRHRGFGSKLPKQPN